MRHRINVMNWKFILAPALASGFLLFAGAPRAKADGCQERLIKADHRLHEAIEHNGPESKQAEHWRRHFRHDRHERRERYERYRDRY